MRNSVSPLLHSQQLFSAIRRYRFSTALVIRPCLCGGTTGNTICSRLAHLFSSSHYRSHARLAAAGYMRISRPSSSLPLIRKRFSGVSWANPTRRQYLQQQNCQTAKLHCTAFQCESLCATTLYTAFIGGDDVQDLFCKLQLRRARCRPNE